MVDMFKVHRACTQIMHDYDGISIQCNYCPVCGTLQISISCPKDAIFSYHQCNVYETDEALTELHILFYDFIEQPEIVEYLRRINP